VTTSGTGTATPYALVSAVEQPGEVTTRELVRISRELEAVALRTRPPATSLRP